MPLPSVGSLTLAPDLILVEPWDEEGITKSGLWADHTWEKEAGHAFGVVVMKATDVTSKQNAALLAELQLGDLILFTRAAHTKIALSWDGQDSDLLLVNIEDCLSILKEEAGGEEATDGDVDGSRSQTTDC